MNLEESTLIENKLTRIAHIAVRLQFWGMFIVLFFIAFRAHLPSKNVGQSFAVVAFISSAILSRIYIHYGKKLETFKTFSSEEGEVRKKEYFSSFFWPYFFWAAVYGIFSWI